MSQAAIAKRVGMGQSTVGDWLAAGAYPETARGPYVSRLDPSRPFLFLRRPEEQADLLTLRQTHPEVNQTYDLVQQFAQMVRTRTGEQLDTWLARVAESQIPELQGFLLGIERDKPAVAAGLTLPHSNGIVEGKVNT